MQLNTWKLWHLFRNSILIYLEVYLQILKVFISFGTNSLTFFLKSSYLFTLSASFPSPTNDKDGMYFKEIRKTIYMDWKLYINQTQCMYLDLNKCTFTNDRRHFSLTIDNAAEGMRQDGWLPHSTDSCDLDLLIVPRQIPVKNMKEHSREIC